MDLVAQRIKDWGYELGFQQVGISGTDLTEAEYHLQRWLKNGFHGQMSYMFKHGGKRSRPSDLIAGTRSIVSVCMDYKPAALDSASVVADPAAAFISRYALGRDYHKVLRSRLQKLADRIRDEIGVFGYRVFVDSAPVLEKAIAENAGLGWIGKHSNLINRRTGSWFFIGEIYTDLDLPKDRKSQEHCGTCSACMTVCPTQAIVAPYQVDARRCISYLTIELKTAIPESLRALIGNRIFGCDDCQLICPWNRFSRLSKEKDFKPRFHLDNVTLLELFEWTEDTFLKKTEGSAIRRIGHLQWLRNIAVALGNGQVSEPVVLALTKRLQHPSELVREHVLWALKELKKQ